MHILCAVACLLTINVFALNGCQAVQHVPDRLFITTIAYNYIYFRQVLEVMAGARNEDPEELAATMFENTQNVFFKN